MYEGIFEEIEKIIATEGRGRNESDHGKQNADYLGQSGADNFRIAILQSLVWADYAKKRTDYISDGLKFFSNAQSRFLEDYATNRPMRNSLQAWKEIIAGEVAIDLSTCNTQAIWFYQHDLLTTAREFREDHHVVGVASWLFCAPFKIILVHRKDLWSDSQIDSILMPLGGEVRQALQHLKEMEHPDFQSLDGLDHEERGLPKEKGLTFAAQECCKPMAKRTNTSILDINSGLHSLARLPTFQHLLSEYHARRR